MDISSDEHDEEISELGKLLLSMNMGEHKNKFSINIRNKKRRIAL